MKQNKEKFSSDPYQRYLQLLHQLIVSLQGDLALGPIIQKATRIIPEYLAVDRASILIYDEEAGGLISDQLLGAPRKAMLSALQPVNVGISGEAFSREALIFVEDCRQTELIEAKYVQQLDLKSVAAIPLRFREKALGVLRLDYTEETHVFSGEEQAFFSLLGEEVGILLGNVLLNSQKKKMANALEESEERFRVAQDMSPDGFTILHPVRNAAGEVVDFTWVYENQAIGRINKTDPKTIVGKRLLDLFPNHRATNIFEKYLLAANTGKTQILEDVYVGFA
jgi:transcriptional regulator with GAF, ATPase, and Fis domain